MITKNEALKISGLFIIWRLFLFAFGLLAPYFLKYDPSFPYVDSLLMFTRVPKWLYSWGGFDGVHYLTILQEGYSGAALIPAFFPLFPLLGRVLNFIIGNRFIAAFLISNFFAWMTTLLFYGLLKQEYPKVKWLALILLLIFPTSFFFGAIYNESIFLSFVLGSFLMARQKRWNLASILVVSASATRIVGVLLVPALLVELWLQTPPKNKRNFGSFLKKSYKKIIVILLGALGLLSYMFYLWKAYHDPLFFLHLQKDFGAGRQTSLILYPQVVFRYLKILLTARPFDLKYYSYVQDFIVGVGGMLGLILSYKKIRLSYLVFAIGAFLVPPLTGTFSSMPRYILVCFPVFIWLALLIKNKPYFKFFVMTTFLLLLILNTMMFVQGYWVA